MRNYIKLIMILIIICSLSTIYSISATDLETGGQGGTKVRDHSAVHNFGNIWLRVSNYGFFGSGNNEPQWPSLEFPGGSGIDYLYQGALWFGAKKIRRDDLGRKMYWLPNAGSVQDIVAEGDEGWTEDLEVVVDTLTSVGFDGDLSLYEFLPAYNPLEPSYLGTQYTQYNYRDKIMTTSIRDQRKGVDDDGDGLIDEDPVGWAFPFRVSDELPDEFAVYGDDFLANSEGTYGTALIEDDLNQTIWFPLGFVELSDQSNELYLFTDPHDDDGDGLYDEDGYPVSEQDFISFYYDYSPFPNGNPDPNRDYGSSSSSSTHVPLNIRVRQMSYQWSYEYIQNLVYVEFNITNMNIAYGDTLFDCAMGIYMDCDVGPQAWGGTEIAPDDLSSYVPGVGYEFAYTWDADFDGGLTQGYVGSRVCTPDPDSLEFACWTWVVGAGPDDRDQLNIFNTGSRPTANQKYWLLTGRNADPGSSSDYTSLRDFPDAQSSATPQGVDTRYLFAFYGDMQGMSHYDDDPETNPTSGSWNLQPGKTMKIVIAIFPGWTLPDLRRMSGFAKMIYGQSQTLTTVVEPDIFPHYEAPEPPDYPKMYAGLINNGNAIEVYWNNRSEFSIDYKFVAGQVVGWQEDNSALDSYYTGNINDYDHFPDEFKPQFNYEGDLIVNVNAEVNPWTAYRLRHDFQGYALYGRSGSGSQEDWEEKGRWDKIETEQDFQDFVVNYGLEEYADYGGNLGIGDLNFSLPDQHELTEEDVNYYKYNELFELVPYDLEEDQYIYGYPIYSWEMTSETVPENVSALSMDDQALLFMSDELRALGAKGEQIYLTLYASNLIPLFGFIPEDLLEDPEYLEELRKKRLSRRYYHSEVLYPPKGIEYYIAMTAWDRGMPANQIGSLESGKDAKANMKILFPGPEATSKMDNIYVVPNPYIGHSMFDGKREKDITYERSRRLWFVNLPYSCTIKIYTLAGDLIDTVKHNGDAAQDVISISKALNIDSQYQSDFSATGIEPWDLLSSNNQIIAPGVYLFSVKDDDSGDIKVGKFVIIK
ncbi:MAG: hypothetical protein APR54_00110 [Candidatus Cloacimonas sp. SDB]|nr:MAG: hypothetical protein APR54_00110 [Candidatus Cloacimonas sp. SDB]